MSATASPAVAQTADPIDDPTILARQVLVEPLNGARLEIDGRLYRGVISLTGHPNGVAVIEETTIDDYLLGIREVPFSWSSEALKAQAVAARTYLAWTLVRGRSSNGRRYGYDICATAACQVYAGVGGVLEADGDRWRTAVESTGGEVLLYRGRPAQALYSSTTSGRTRNVEDVFVGSSPLPYLRGVPSPGEQSPFVDWSFMVDAQVMADLLDHAGLLDGDLVDVVTETTENGSGPWLVRVEGTGGSMSIDTWTLRGRLNRAASELYPDLFPATRPGSDRRYPTTVLSPTYTISAVDEYGPPLPGTSPVIRVGYRVDGGGWGHDVGMSQYGAQAMALAGAGYADILAHYYGSLRPRPAPELLPASVRVGLAVGLDAVGFSSSGPVRVTIDGKVVAEADLGSWSVTAHEGRLLVTPPIGLGLPPALTGWRVSFDESGRPSAVSVDSATAARIRVTVVSDRGRAWDSGWDVADAGVVTIDLVVLGMAFEQGLTVEVMATSSHGSVTDRLRLIDGLE